MDFLTGKPLSDTIYDTLSRARKELIIISPNIQIDSYLRESIFKLHINNPKLHIIIGFKSYKDDNIFGFRGSGLEYFLNFPNLTLIYIPQLNAKYYANERQSVITSMGLSGFPLTNSIELGVFTLRKSNFLGKNSFYETSKNTIMDIIDSGYTVFVKRPYYGINFLGFGKKYTGDAVYLNLLDDVMANRSIEHVRYSFLISKFEK